MGWVAKKILRIFSVILTESESFVKSDKMRYDLVVPQENERPGTFVPVGVFYPKIEPQRLYFFACRGR